jgi:cytidine deaminase
MATLSATSAVQNWDAWKLYHRGNVVNKEAFDEDCKYLEDKRVKSGKSKSFATGEEINFLTQWAPAQRERTQQHLNSAELTDTTVKTLIMQAQIARMHTSSPYSNYPVGAAILSVDGHVFTGCNVENAAYGSTICAERTALLKAMSELNERQSCIDKKEFSACAVVLRYGASPCGSCRQMLNEVNPGMRIIMADIDGEIKENMALSELLPLAFGPNNL